MTHPACRAAPHASAVPPLAVPRRRDRKAMFWRAAGSLAVLGMLAACSGGGGGSANQEAAAYQARARGDYRPPGPPGDPWGPYIAQASQRFDVPQEWIRAVMHVESGGHEYLGGHLTTSPVGAMGLMQVMPETYDELRARYNLGDDPYDPRNNILAGTAYIREMYDIYGSPGFLAAYNAGPRRLDDYLANDRPLPDETRRYVAMIAPHVVGEHPLHRSPAEQYAMNALPVYIPAGPRYAHGMAMAENRTPAPPPRAYAPVVAAPLPEPERARPAPQMQLAYAPPPPPPPPHHGFRLIPSAMAEPLPVQHGGPATGGWAIQVGAFGNPAAAHDAAMRAEQRAALRAAHPYVGSVRSPLGMLYRARLTGLSREAAVAACAKLGGGSCIVLSPEAQS